MEHQVAKDTEPIKVGDITLDPCNHLLILNGQKMHLRPKTFKVLQVLLNKPRKIVSKHELMTEVWGGIVISEDCLTQCIMELRKVLHDESREVIKTYPKYGYCLEPDALQVSMPPPANRSFVFLWLIAGVVLTLAIVALWHAYTSSSQSSWQPASTRSIAVLPLFGIDKVDFGGLGKRFIEDEVVRLVSEHTELQTVSRSASFKAYQKFSDDYEEVAKSLRVAYLLIGKVKNNNQGQSLSLSLIKADNQHVVWSQSFYGALDEVSLVPFYITNRLITFFSEPEIMSKGTSYEPLATEYYLQGKQFFDLKGEHNLHLAKDKYLKALELEPKYADALAGLSSVYLFIYWASEGSDINSLIKARQYAEQALNVAPNHPIANIRMADTLFFEQGERSMYQRNFFEKALVHEPDNTLVLGRLAGSYMYESELGKALAIQKKLVAVNPKSFVNRINLAHLYYYLEEYDNALSELPEVIEFNNERSDEVLILQTKILLIQEKMQEARETISQLTTGKYQFMFERYVDGKLEVFDFEPASCSTRENLRFCLDLAELYVLYGLDEPMNKVIMILEQELPRGRGNTAYLSLVIGLANSPFLKDKSSVKKLLKTLQK
ncbi:winged helix-turn-helix domain-containing protein [Kangiella shandongensis]|uniref:winged helix-turn-helix domain-containing protein n=1 Tax=Kangiella shandongensis TaxID=2763258 RepID=UPI001CC18DE5|nr:winged helix-turn-helix domain-containing protein [Kangiella shandongensis]